MKSLNENDIKLLDNLDSVRYSMQADERIQVFSIYSINTAMFELCMALMGDNRVGHQLFDLMCDNGDGVVYNLRLLKRDPDYQPTETRCIRSQCCNF